MKNVTVNGQSIEQYLKQQQSDEKSREIAMFLKDEMRSFGRMTHSHFTTANGGRNVSKVKDVGNGVLRCE